MRESFLDWLFDTIGLAAKLFRLLLATAMALIMLSLTLFAMAYFVFEILFKMFGVWK